MEKTVKEFHDLVVNCQPFDLREFKEVLPELVPHAACIQDPQWHGELDVLTHLNMAKGEAFNLLGDFPKGFAQVALYMGTMIHDIGKPDAAKPKANGYNSFHGHEKMGVWRAKEFIKKYFPEYNYRQRDLILNLVEYHGHPKRMTEDGSKDDRFKRLSLEVPTPFIYALEIADFLGRTASDKEKALNILHQFKKRCEDLDIYKNHGYQIPNSDALTNLQYSLFRWNILMHHAVETDQREIDRIIKLTDRQTTPEFTLLVGAPGSGKTTYRSYLTNTKVISMDDERQRLCGTPNDMSRNQEVFNNCFREFNNALKAGENVCWDAVAPTRKARKTLINAARQYGAQVNIIYWDLPVSTLLERNVSREKVVPDEIVWKYFKELETPASYEYDRLMVFEK